MFEKILKSRNLLTLLITIFVFWLIFILSYLWIFYSSDKNLQNTYYKIKANLFWFNVSKDLIIVEIDENTLGKLWSFPFNRKIYSDFIGNLTNAWVSVIWFDIIFEDKWDEESDNIFSESIKKSKNIIFWLSFWDNNSIKLPLKTFDDNLLSKGYLRPSIDRKTNTIYSIIPSSSFWWIQFEHFSVTILKAYYSYIYNKNFNDIIVGKKWGYYYLTPQENSLNSNESMWNNSSLGIRIPFATNTNNKFLINSNSEKEILINYVDRDELNNVSFIDIYEKDEFKELQKYINFKDKIVIVGTTAKWIKDVFNTPAWIEYWVYVHANMINTVLTKSFLVYFDKNIEWILILLLIMISVYFNLSHSWFILIFSNLIIIFIFFIIFPITVLSFTNLIINYTAELIFALIFSLTLSNIIKFIIENKSKLRLNKALSEYVSHDIAEEILYGSWKVNLNWEEKEVVIFFSDIVWFTWMSEKFTAKELVSFLREYLTKMSDLIIEERGFVNKYEWDAILALWWVFWSDLNLSYRACLSAIKQQRLLRELNKKWKETWFEEIKIKIWIHIWNAIIWNIGSKWKKIEFTALWDNVNLTSRLEWVNKYYNTTICVSEDIYNHTKDLFEFRYLDKIKVKWKKIIVNIYELLEEKWKITEMKKDIISKFGKAIRMYLERDFENAMEIFLNLEKFQDWPSSTYIKRCEKFINKPPSEDWDWSWTMKEK